MRVAEGDPVVDIVLRPGGFHFGGGRMRIRTLLGSCVAITIWHPSRRVGGMCHYLLPRRPPSRARGELDGRYGDEAMRMFMKELARTHAAPAECVAKLFGGAKMIADSSRPRPGATLWERNVAHGRELLARHGFAIVAQHVGGTSPRSLVFELWSGDVWLRST